MKVRPWIIPVLVLVVLLALILPACSSTTTQTATQTATQTVTQTATSTGTTTSTATQTTTKTTTATSTTKTTTTTDTGTPQKGGTLRIIWSNTPASGFGWAPKIFGGEGFAAEPAMESLWEAKFTGGDYVMRLATGYEVAADGLSITANLRQGVKFHDGTDFNAAAVKYNFDAMIAAGRISSNFKSVEVVDNNIVKFNLETWRNTAINAIAGVVIASPTGVETNGADWAAINAIGTGPFKQVSYEPDVKIRLERFDDYWGDKAYLDAIEGTFIADTMTQTMAMQSGEGDVAHSRQAKVNNAMHEAGFNILQNYMGMVAANFDSGNAESPWADVKVREAFEYAVNKKAIVDTLGYGYWEAATQFALPGQNGYLADIKVRSFNPDQARVLLQEAGWGDGFDTKIIHAIGDFDDGVVAVQADLADVGINAVIDTIDWAKWGTMRQQGWQGIFCAGSGVIANWNNLMDTYFATGRTEMFSILRPAGFQALIDQALTANPESAALTQACSRVVYDQVLWSPIEHHGDNYAYTDKVHGLNFGTYGQWGAFDAEKVWLSK